ncbi:Uu.00g054250.m01.CDS01 [Anthostomella pinea]|uniref:Uu.00g054250.m01.CDS01 n=1 Tax=Anthostomella pinea TaxID=933095 RepID=A0AAI8YPN1_9PEZI|nr:Uu.00g054250.m01.CDS01 [Anthostomella pinea]
MTVILVTGGNRGIGLAIVQAVGTRVADATVLVGCRSTANAEEPIKELKKLGVPAKLKALEITITDDASIRAAVKVVEENHGKLDVLINNAAAVTLPKSTDLTDVRESWARTLDCVATSQVLVTKAFLPLLRKAEWGRVVMNSSARGSIGRNIALELPPSPHWLYNCSKAALNLATIDFRNAEVRDIPDERDHITFWTVSPGHCKTGFNNFRGVKDPAEGAEVIARLLESKRGEISSATFWEFEEGKFQQVPW